MQTRYLVRRQTKEVFVWTEQLAKRADLEEVYANTPAEAMKKPAMPGKESISMEQIESMTKADLLIFGSVKLGIEMPEDETKVQLQDRVKEAVLLAPTREVMAAAERTGPFVTARDAMRGPNAGMKIDVPPKKGAAGASDKPDQSVQP